MGRSLVLCQTLPDQCIFVGKCETFFTGFPAQKRRAERDHGGDAQGAVAPVLLNTRRRRLPIRPLGHPSQVKQMNH